MLLRGFDGCVVLSPRTCEAFAPLLREVVDRLVRRDGVRFPNEIFEELSALEAAAAASRQHRASLVDGFSLTKPPPLSAANMSTVKELSVSEAARTVGRTRQAVLARIRSGSLPARRDERGRWRIRCENLPVRGAEPLTERTQR
jgi:hypothetical protein